MDAVYQSGKQELTETLDKYALALQIYGVSEIVSNNLNRIASEAEYTNYFKDKNLIIKSVNYERLNNNPFNISTMLNNFYSKIKDGE